jgi:hypothetical protein
LTNCCSARLMRGQSFDETNSIRAADKVPPAALDAR